MTSEQRIRGADADVDWALLVTGYEQDAVSGLGQAECGVETLEAHGATGVTSMSYQAAYALTDREAKA